MTIATPGKLSKSPSLRMLILVGMLLGTYGCSTMGRTGTPRSGTEQLLLTNTWDQVLNNVDLHPLRGSSVFLDTNQIEAADKGWVIATLQRNLLRHGVILKDEKKDAKLILVVALAAYGTDQRDFIIGFQGGDLNLAGLSISRPESAPNLFRAVYQSSVVKLVMFAYELKTSRLVWEAVPISGSALLSDRFVVGTGPRRQAPLTDLQTYPATRVRRAPTFPYREEPPESITWTSAPDNTCHKTPPSQGTFSGSPKPPRKGSGSPRHSKPTSSRTQPNNVSILRKPQGPSTWAIHDRW
ncbi:MAG: DUF6655 family protein [Gemmataceae bacterium]